MSEKYRFNNSLLRRYIFLVYYAQKSYVCLAKPLIDDAETDKYFLENSHREIEDLSYPEWEIFQDADVNMRTCIVKKIGILKNSYLIYFTFSGEFLLLSPNFGKIFRFKNNYGLFLSENDLINSDQILVSMLDTKTRYIMSPLSFSSLDILKSVDLEIPEDFLKEETYTIHTIRNSFLIKDLLKPYLKLIDIDEKWTRSSNFDYFRFKLQQKGIAEVMVTIRFPFFMDTNCVRGIISKVVAPELLKDIKDENEMKKHIKELNELITKDINYLEKISKSSSKVAIPRFRSDDFIKVNTMEFANIFYAKKDQLSNVCINYDGFFDDILNKFQSLFELIDL